MEQNVNQRLARVEQKIQELEEKSRQLASIVAEISLNVSENSLELIELDMVTDDEERYVRVRSVLPRMRDSYNSIHKKLRELIGE